MRKFGTGRPPDTTPATARPARFNGAVLVAVGPGERAGLEDLIASIRHYEGDGVKIVVADDLTEDYPPGETSEAFPGVDFIRPRVSAGTKYRPFPTLQAGLLHILSHYDVPVILKLDPDSLMIGPGSFDLSAERFQLEPAVGLLGTTGIQADGEPTDYRWISWMAHPELRWSGRFRRLFRLAEANSPPPHFAHAGAYYLSSRAALAALSVGLLPYRQPVWSLQGDDLILGLIVRAAGFRIQSFGAPGDPIACAARYLPVEPGRALEEGFKVVHSVRTTPAGLSESEVRAAFRLARSGSAPATGERGIDNISR